LRLGPCGLDPAGPFGAQKKLTKFDAGKEAIESLAKVVAYAICANLFFLLLEVFVVFYSNIPDHKVHFHVSLCGLPRTQHAGALDVVFHGRRA
jgi:hypothetical protein